MATSLAEIRAKLKAQEDRSTGGGSKGGDKSIYRHWDIAENTTARIRLLPDGNTSNSYFWVERLQIKLPFPGVKGQPNSKPVTVQVPCVEMYGPGNNCPILAEVRTWFKDPALEDMGRKYWKKKSYLFQGFVRDNPLADDVTPANPIRRFVMGPQLFNIIKSALMDPELENLPTDFQAGLDFQISKTAKANYADYTTSKWSRKESALTALEQAAIDEHGLFDLSTFLPKQPGEVELKVIKEMFEASVDGQPYDLERWGKYYKPFGLGDSNAADADAVDADATPVAATPAPRQAPKAAPAPVVEADDDEVAATAPVAKSGDSGKRAEDIIALIRSRQNKK